ncbi:hypothetical protein EON73_05220, partial [bacterium]
MPHSTIIVKTFETALGNVDCGIVSDHTRLNLFGHNIYENGKSEIFDTVGHRIELIEFKIRQPLYNGETFTDSFGWIWKIRKMNADIESLETFCLFDKPTDHVEFD